MSLNKYFSNRIILYFCLIIILAAILRLYNLGNKPHDLYVDEVDIGWNAYSILKTGRDEHGKFMPIFFESFGDFKLPAYIYLTTISEAVFGKSAFAVRLTSALAGITTITVFILLTQHISKSWKLALLAGLLLTISPWHLLFTRAGFEASLSRCFTTIGLYCLILDLDRKHKTFFWGITSFILALYSYHTARITVPLGLLFLIVWKIKELPRIFSRKWSFIKIIVLSSATVPFIIYAFSVDGLARAQSQSFIRDLPSIIKDDHFKTNIWEIEHLTENYLTYFSLDYLFFSGDSIGRHSIPGMGMTYLWQLPFFLVGMYVGLKRKQTAAFIYFIWFLITPAAAALATPNPHALRGLTGSISLTFFVSFGIYISLSFLKKIRYATLIFCLTVGYACTLFLHLYFHHYPKLTSPDWFGGYKEVVEYGFNNSYKYDAVNFTNSMLKGYAFLYFYNDFSPAEVLKAKNYQLNFGKFTFINDPYIKPIDKKVLYVSNQVEIWTGKLLKVVNNSGDDPAFQIWEN